MNISALPADTYVVINKTILCEQDRKILLSLYEPIIGSLSISLFLTLWTILDKNEIMSMENSHHDLMCLMQLSLSDIEEARKKLEAIGLLKTYYKKDNINKYIYELYSPLNINDFFNNPMLNTLLYTNIGKEEYTRLINYYKIPNIKKDDYEDISCCFNDVFTLSDVFENDLNNLKKINTLDINISIKFDLDDIINSIPDEMLNKKINKTLKDDIYKLMYVYDFSSSDVTELIRNSIDEKHNISFELLKENAKKYYSFEHIGKLPTLIYKSQPEYLRKEITGTSKKDKIIYKFETMSPYDFLYEKNGFKKPSISDINIVEYLLIEQNMNPGVINVLLDYVLKINNNKLTKAYVSTIASQWVKSNIKTVVEAMTIAEKEYKGRNKIKNNVKISKNVPSWFDKKIENNEVSIEEQQKFEELLNNLK